MYRPRSHDFLDDPLERAFFPDDPEMDPLSDMPESYLSQPALYSASYDAVRHQGPSGCSLSQPTGRHVSFKTNPSQLGPRDHNERPASLGSGGGSNGMRTLREDPAELRSSDDEGEQRPVVDTRAESDSTVSDREYDPFNRESRKSIRDGPVLEQWENALETRGIPLVSGRECVCVCVCVCARACVCACACVCMYIALVYMVVGVYVDQVVCEGWEVLEAVTPSWCV